MAVTREAFRQVMGQFGTGVTIVTTWNSEGHPYGLTVNAFSAVSLNPLLILICLDNQLSGLEAFRESNQFGVNILAEDQEDLSHYFAQKGTDRSQADYAEGQTGVPLLKGVLATLECEIRETFPGGDHTIVLGEVKSAEITEAAESKGPLLFVAGQYRRI